MLKCRVLHMHMIKVVEQNEIITKVPRWFDSPIHLYGGLLGIVALVAEFSIYFGCQRPQWIHQRVERWVIQVCECEQPSIRTRVVCWRILCVVAHLIGS